MAMSKKCNFLAMPPADCLESATSAAGALSEVDGTGQRKRHGRDRDGTGAIGFYPGHWSESRGRAEEDGTAGGMR